MLFPFPPIPILSMLKFYIISDTVNNIFLITEILIIYYHYTKNVCILVTLQTSYCTFSVINYAKNS